MGPLVGRARGRDDPARAGAPQQLHEQRADPAAGGIDEHLPAFDRRVAREAECRQALDHQRRRVLERQRVRDRRDIARVDDDAFRIAARLHAGGEQRCGDAVADGNPAHAVAGRDDDPRHLAAGHPRQGRRERVAVLAQQRVGQVDAGGVHAHLHLSRCGGRVGKVDGLEHVGAAEAVELDGFHRKGSEGSG
jgi:hypothetical protein